mgnify:CR=1 FL=1
MHAGFAHIFFNMFAVWMFGRILEQVWGPKRFLFYYLVCGIGAGIIQEVVQYIHYETVLSAYDSVNTGMAIIPMEEYLNMMTTVGASGAVYAILLAFGMLFPNQQMFIFPLPVPIKAKYFVIGYALIELMPDLQTVQETMCSLRTSGWYGIRLYPDYVLEKKEQRKWLLL